MKKVCSLLFFPPTENFFTHDFLFSFPRESSFPRRISGSEYYNLISNLRRLFCVSYPSTNVVTWDCDYLLKLLNVHVKQIKCFILISDNITFFTECTIVRLLFFQNHVNWTKDALLSKKFKKERNSPPKIEQRAMALFRYMKTSACKPCSNSAIVVICFSWQLSFSDLSCISPLEFDAWTSIERTAASKPDVTSISALHTQQS